MYIKIYYLIMIFHNNMYFNVYVDLHRAGAGVGQPLQTDQQPVQWEHHTDLPQCQLLRAPSSHVSTFRTSYRPTAMSTFTSSPLTCKYIKSVTHHTDLPQCQLLRAPSSHVSTFRTSYRPTAMSTFTSSLLTCKYIQDVTQNYPNVNFYELPPHM